MKASRLSLTLSFAVMLSGLTAVAQNLSFSMVRSAGAEATGCLPNATARVTISSVGIAEFMNIEAKGLPPNTDFDAFIIQLANAPFGLSWYQGDLKTDDKGTAVANFIGRFNEETFIVAPGSGPAPVKHPTGPFPDANTNPPTHPVHTYHIGLWFNSPVAAASAGCGSAVTPFNGTHNAGAQALSTRNFGTLGPLGRIQ
jgi:hypothetical protein